MTKALLILIASIAATETAIMTLLAAVGEEQLSPWLPALFDATAVSLVAIITINRMLKHSLISLRGSGSGEFIQLKIGAIVFTFELIIMLLLMLPPLTLNPWQESLFDVVSLTLGSSLVIYCLILKPASEESHNIVKSGFDPTIATNILGYVCLMILLLMALVSTYDQQLQQRSIEDRQQEIKKLELTKAAFLNNLHYAARDLLIMSNQKQLQELANGDIQTLYKLQRDYRNIVDIKYYYAQLRFIDNEGNEIIRIQHDNGLTQITPHDQLQNKKDRYYFQESLQLSTGEIYISPLDLNIERGEVERPFNPMIRLITPVIDNHGNRMGIFVINLKGNYLLKELENVTQTATGKVMLLNEQGYWLSNSESDTLWAFMFPEKSEQRFQLWYPEVWTEIEHMERGTFTTDKGTFIVETIEFSSDDVITKHADQHNHEEHARRWPIWKLVSHIPTNIISEQMLDLRKLMIIIYIVALVLAAAGIAILTQAMLKRRQTEIEVHQLAFYDALTGLASRSLFSEKVTLEMSHARREKTTLTLMYLDLDHFKPINDELGHDAGDEALREVAARLKECMRDCDTIGRLGGDEFVTLLPKSGSHDDIARIAQRIIDRFSEAFYPLGHTRNLGISIGIAILAEADENPRDFTQRADHAMYEAKHSGRNCYRFAKDELG